MRQFAVKLSSLPFFLAISLLLLFFLHRKYYNETKDRHLGNWRNQVVSLGSKSGGREYRSLVQLYPTLSGPTLFSGTIGLPGFRFLLGGAVAFSFLLLGE